MTEREVIDRLRALDGPVDPDPEFREALLRSLWSQVDVGGSPAVRPLADEPMVTVPVAPGGAPARRPPGGLLVAAVAFLFVVLAGAATWWLTTTGESGPAEPAATTGPSTTTTSESAVTSTAAPPDRLAITRDLIGLPAGLHPADAARDGDRWWILVRSEVPEPGGMPPESATLLGIEAADGDITVRLDLTGRPTLVTVGEGAIWVAHFGASMVSKVDPESGEVAAEIPLVLPYDVGSGPDRNSFLPNDLAVGHGAIWVSTARGAVARIDPDTDTVTAVVELSLQGPQRLAIGDDAVWVAEDVHGLTRIDADTLEPTTVEAAPATVGHVTVIDGVVYVSGTIAGSEVGASVVGIIEATGTVNATTNLAIRPAVLTWVDAFFGALDPATGDFWHLGDRPQLVGNVSRTNWHDEYVLAAVGRETWMLDARRSRLVRLRETGPAVPDIDMNVDVAALIETGPVPTSALESPNWARIDDPPWLLTDRPAIIFWTGAEIVGFSLPETSGGTRRIGDGAAFDPAAGTWREVGVVDLPASTGIEWVWTGTELVVWTSGRTAAAWDPSSDSWRMIDDWPLPVRLPPVQSVHGWTGEEIVDVTAGLAVDPITGAAREIAEPPPLAERASAVAAEGVLVTPTSDGVYDPDADSWSAMPSSGLEPVWIRGAWTGDEMVAVDYRMRAATYDPVANEWSSLPPVPIRFYECGSSVYVLDGEPIAQLCGTIALWVADGEWWLPLHLPEQQEGGATPIAAGGDLFAWADEGLYRFTGDVPAGVRRVAVGDSILDLPDGWRVTTATGGSTIRVELTDGADRCSVSGVHADTESVLRPYVAAGALVERTRAVGGPERSMLEVPVGAIDDRHHLVWATGTTDVVDVACTSPTATGLVADRMFSRWARPEL